MKKRNFTKEDEGVAGVIEALLMVALVAIVISTIQLIYIPQVMNQREAEHMDTVSNQFSYLKSMIDIQSMTGSNAPVFSMITLGSRELPYFVTARAFGELYIVNSEQYRIEILASQTPFPVHLTSITYDAYNSYFVDQTYVLEGGGIIVMQPDGKSVMRVDPAISYTIDGTKVIIHFDLPVFSSAPGKNSTEGYGKCVIRTNYSGDDPEQTPINITNYIRIYTKYLNAWHESLNNSLGTVVNITPGSNYIEITQLPGGKHIYLDFRRIYIHVQIGPGWVI